MKTYLYVDEDRIQISLDSIRWKSADKCSKRRFCWKRFGCAISVSPATTAVVSTAAATTPSSSSERGAIFPNRNGLRRFYIRKGRKETESKALTFLPGRITKTVEKSTTPATVEVVRHVGRTENRP